MGLAPPKALNDLIEPRLGHRPQPPGHLAAGAEVLVRFRVPAEVEQRLHLPLVREVLDQQGQKPVTGIVGQQAALCRMHVFQGQDHRRGVGPVSPAGQLHHRDHALAGSLRFSTLAKITGRRDPIVREPTAAKRGAQLQRRGRAEAAQDTIAAHRKVGHAGFRSAEAHP
jgi:hypothetical protein